MFSAIFAHPAGPILAATVLVSALGGAWIHGHSVGTRNANNACAASQLESVQRAVEQAQTLAAQDAEVSTEYESTRTIYLDRWRHVEIPIPADCAQCSLTDAGLGLLNRARDGQLPDAPTAPGQPDATVSRPQPPHWGDVQPNHGVLDGNFSLIQRLPSEAQSSGRKGI